MGKIIYDPKKDTFETQWERMELRKDGATVWIGGKSYELNEEESANLLFQHTTQNPEKIAKLEKEFLNFAKGCIKDYGIDEVRRILRMLFD